MQCGLQIFNQAFCNRDSIVWIACNGGVWNINLFHWNQCKGFLNPGKLLWKVLLVLVCEWFNKVLTKRNEPRRHDNNIHKTTNLFVHLDVSVFLPDRVTFNNQLCEANQLNEKHDAQNSKFSVRASEPRRLVLLYRAAQLCRNNNCVKN